MDVAFEDITVTKFDIGEQDRESAGIFHFKFLLSQTAPHLWLQIAAERVEQQGWKLIIRWRGSVYPTMFVVGCTADEAQRIKVELNSQILPRINQDYRQRESEQRARQDALEAAQAALRSAAEQAVKDQR